MKLNVPYAAEITGSSAKTHQMPAPRSLRISARIHRTIIAHTS